MPRAARVTPARKLSDSDEESTDVEVTPKAKKSTGGNPRLKRRVSQFQPSIEEDSEQRIPLKPFNDEAAEKRSLKRRKSSRMTMAFDASTGSQEDQEAGGDASTPAEGPKTPRKTALARANQLKSVAVPGPMVPVPLEIMTSNFEEWMKMATDNKINANNSWSFALIDYFHDMSLLRNDGDNTINFQKASRTLDGCVKIWTSRVDSVGTDTGKLLSNLAAEGRGGGEEVEGEEGAEGPDGVKKRKAHRQEATLAKSAAQLQTKKLDLEFTIDPLFKKTSGDFDEGGAQGLLMNHLSVDAGLRVIFDAMDTPGGAEEADEDEVVNLQVSLADLRAKLDYRSLGNRQLLSERLSNFKFAATADAIGEDSLARGSKYNAKDDELDSEDEADFQDQPAADEMDIVAEVPEGQRPPDVEPQDFFAGDEGGGGDDYGGDYDGGGDYADHNGEPGEMVEAEGAEQSGARQPGVVPFDPRRNLDQRELVMAMTEDGGASMMDYFDASITKNWAGPEHWKLRKVIRKPDRTEASTAPKPRKEKEVFSIDFSTRNTADFEKKLFEPPAKGSLTLPAKQCAYIGGKRRKGASEKREEKLLPDDMHFSNKQLLSLFLKPKFMVNFRGHRAWLRPEHSDEIDENFWAQAAADAAMPTEDGGNPDGEGMPFATQFFNDDDDYGGGGFDDDGGGEGIPQGLDEDAELLAATQGQVRRVRPEFVKYAKKVKRVDVRKLKENIWKGLDIVLPKEEDEDIDPKTLREPTDPQDAKQFTSVISGLRKTYPKEKMEEISTSFCFICLLHLANERGLQIKGEEDSELGSKMSGLSISGNAARRRMMDEDDPDAPEIDEADDSKEQVGDIWGLRIYRDPDAIPSA